ncbi:MAG TPA: hypothetical protein VFU21_02100 [Kofleriaceae bacterium]|nr:hypothetical protein [Kofleriaceae bacterium]
MSLTRQANPAPRLRRAIALLATAGGVAGCAAAAVSLLSPPGPTARLVAAGGMQAIPVLVMLMAGAILWSFGAAAIAVTRSRWSPYVSAATIGAGAIGITAGAPLLFGPYGVLVAGGAAAVLAGVILVGGGVLARGI